MGSTSKCQKQLSEEVEIDGAKDRISNLPKSIIGHILSFLPTESAVGTSILSTKWKWMWTSISNLDFDDNRFVGSLNNYDDYVQHGMNFSKFVNRVLLLLEGSNVNKFHLKIYLVPEFSHVNTWVTAALSLNVRELCICIPFESSISLPAELFTHDKLEVLKLKVLKMDSDFVLKIPSIVCLRSLKTLVLYSVDFRDEESVRRLLSGCPVLEVLALQLCGGKNVKVVTISAPALKRLIFGYPAPDSWMNSCIDLGCYPRDVCTYEIELDTPSLMHLEYEGLVAEGFTMNDLTSLVEADIDFIRCDEQSEAYYNTAMTKLVQGIYNVQTLLITGDCFKTIEDYSGLTLPVFRNLTSLELGTNRHVTWKLLPDLLACSPKLITLVFNKGLLHEECDSDFWEWSPPERVPTCLLVSLEEIEIYGFRGEECELKVVEYFLMNAKVLKILELHILKSQDCEKSEQILLEEALQVSKVSKKLLEMPRGSPSSKVVVS